eukprot:TRINITY_DN2996_c0_g1_i1.p1 TRINITY_DN2996_c0_g1~~TRINITY_DN2996_c0_g1_i1.p1  ORF type:complete len:454 (+),score=118.29 TRINITY_DN2996_c0_g1_i1:56-1417(+)
MPFNQQSYTPLVRPDSNVFDSIDDLTQKTYHTMPTILRPPVSPSKDVSPGYRNDDPRLFNVQPYCVAKSSLFDGLDPEYALSEDGSTYFDRAFKTIKILGEGCFSIAYLVQSRSDDQFYVIKVMKSAYTSWTDRRNKIYEARVQAHLGLHPFICSLYLAWEEHGRLYLLSEYCPNGTLAQKLSEDKLLEDRIWDYFVSILLGLYHIHRADFCHFDLKPGNIFLNEDGDLIIGDFGLARVSQDASDHGDPKYVAPELLEFGIEPSSAADMFSLGIMMFEMAANVELPSSGRIWRKLRSGNVTLPNNAGRSQQLEELIGALMNQKPEDRPSSYDLLNVPLINSMIEGKYNTSDPFPFEEYVHETVNVYDLMAPDSRELEADNAPLRSSLVDAADELNFQRSFSFTFSESFEGENGFPLNFERKPYSLFQNHTNEKDLFMEFTNVSSDDDDNDMYL